MLRRQSQWQKRVRMTRRVWVSQAKRERTTCCLRRPKMKDTKRDQRMEVNKREQMRTCCLRKRKPKIKDTKREQRMTMRDQSQEQEDRQAADD